MKRKNLIKLIEASCLLNTALVVLTGCSNETNDKVTTTYQDSNDDIKNDIFVTNDEFIINKWYVINTKCGDKEDVIITKKMNIDKIDADTTRYYYTNALADEFKVNSVLYNRYQDKYWVETGPDIISAVPISDYIEKYDMQKQNYSKDDINNLLVKVKDEYKEEKELEGKGRVLIMSNSLY